MAYDPNNIFAKILRNELPAIRIYEDADTLVFMDIMPQADGHVLVIPKEAAETLMDLSEESARACIVITRHLAAVVKQALGPPAVSIMQMNGAAAGQTVPHCHFHVIPRSPGASLGIHAAERADPEKLEAIARKIRDCLP